MRNAKIIYENNDFLIVDKPSGLLTVETGRGGEQTAYREVTAHVRQVNPRSRVFIVHRLDRDTSGLLVFAKNERTKRYFQDNWQSVALKRGYSALTEGCPEPPEGIIRSFLHETKTRLMYSGAEQGGLEAITRYRVVKRFGKYSLVSLELETGRKNQIRVHMHDIGTPVAGDKKYGAATNPARRLCLHCSELVLLTEDGEMRFTSPVPKFI